MINQTISHYNILEKLGEGGMGIVYKAHDTKLDRCVAIKFLSASQAVTEKDRTRFIYEARAASALEHSNICAIYEIDETTDGQLFLVMPCYEGTPLNEKIEKGPLPLNEAIDIAIQIADGLQAAHEKGIVHRDIKSSNIFITQKGQVKIMDFGLARSPGMTQVTKTGTTVGTVPYMSPEQAQGVKVDHRTDIWSLGAVLYEMIAGKRPFEAVYEQAVVYKIINVDPEPLTALRTGIPMELERTVMKAMEKDPAARYQHTDELLTDLSRIQKSPETKHSRQVIPLAPSYSSRWRISRTSVFIVLVVSALAAIVYLFYPSEAIPFSERDWILIADFDNLTGEEVFDKSLNTALSISIGQSRYVNILPKRRIEESLRRIKKPEAEHIDESIAQEIAVREGINVILLPSISRIGDSYILAGVLRDPVTGETYRSEMVYARQADEIVIALDEFANKIRRHLGESMSKISKQNKPLVKATTSSLEALRHYSLGIENHRNGNITEAKMCYENALRIDSTFTAARASLGMIHVENFDRETGIRLLSRAMQSVDDLTDKERLGILAFYSRAVKDNLDEAIDYWKTLIALYPDYSHGYNNLGWHYFQSGKYEEAAGAYRSAINLDPDLMVSYDGLNRIYIYFTGQIKESLWLLKQQLERNPDNYWSYDNLGWVYFGLDSLQQAETIFLNGLELYPNASRLLYRLSYLYSYQNRYSDAIDIFQKTLDLYPEHQWAHFYLGLNYRRSNNEEMAVKHFEHFFSHAKQWVRDAPHNPDNYIALAFALTQLGEKQEGWEAGQKAIEINPDCHFDIAQLLSMQGRTTEALDNLELAIQQGMTNYIWIKVHPFLYNLYDEPGFQELISRVL